MTKKILLLSFVAILGLGFIAPVLAKETKSFEKKITKGGNVYITGNEIEVIDPTEGDLFVSGSQIKLNGIVNDNIFAAGDAVLINGDVLGDIYVAGSYVVVNGSISGDVRIVASKVYINSVFVNGDLNIFAGEVSFGENVVVYGDKEYSAGKVTDNNADNPKDLSQFVYKEYSLNLVNSFTNLGVTPIVTIIIFKLMMIIGSIAAAYILIRLFPVFSEKTMLVMKEYPKKSLVFGYLVIFLALPLAIGLALSVIGWQLLFVFAVLGAIAMYFAYAYSSYLVGRYILVRFDKTHTGRLLPLAIGIILIELVMYILPIIPFVGGMIVLIIKSLMVALGVGAIVYTKYTSFKYKSQKNYNLEVKSTSKKK